MLCTNTTISRSLYRTTCINKHQIKELEKFVRTSKFYCLHALADSHQLREKMLEFSPKWCYLHHLCTVQKYISYMSYMRKCQIIPQLVGHIRTQQSD